MPNLYSISLKNKSASQNLSESEIKSIVYHNIFDYPLNIAELIKWLPADSIQIKTEGKKVSLRGGYYFLEEKDGLVYKRLLRKRISGKKLEIAKKVSGALNFIPSILMVGVTGSLAMENSSDESDIDLIIITKHDRLWTTRLISYLLISLIGTKARKSGDKEQKDRLCLNMWMDENDLLWGKSDRNFYTAHEIAQILPLVNKNSTYEKFLLKNKWISEYWPNAVKVQNSRPKITKLVKTQKHNPGFSILERLAFASQYRHMRSKITREVVTPTRAIFHPQDWGRIVLERLST